MIIALCILAYLFIGWIVASICLTISMRNNNKTELSSDFVLPFILWPLVIMVYVIRLIGMIIMRIGRMTEKIISKLTKGVNK